MLARFQSISKEWVIHSLLTTEMIKIDTRDIMPEETISTLRTIEDLRKQPYKRFVEERILSRQKSIDDTIKRNNISLFNYKTSQKSNKAGYKVLKNDIKLFSQLFIAAQSRGTDLDDFLCTKTCHILPPLLKMAKFEQELSQNCFHVVKMCFKFLLHPLKPNLPA